MRLTRFTDNALRCLIYLGRNPEGTPTVGEIAERMNMSEDHLTKVVQRLAQGGVVLTVRGRHGGVRLAMAPEEINLGRVVRDCEEGFQIVPCFADPASCPISSNCLLASICDQALAAFLGVMDRHHLSDLLREAAPAAVPSPLGRARG
jgi:Rrf2 family nitric oxide-sensitive transcriptional repressor